MTNKIENAFEICGNYVTMYTSKNEPFYVDLEDFEKVRKYYWSKDKDGYIIHTKGKSKIRLHRFITNCPDDLIPDHIHGKPSRNDNRKANLRLVTVSQNGMNREIGTNNSSGIVGVSWHKQTGKWIARIQIDKKRINLGLFDNFDDAVEARKEAEQKYFGEYSYDNSQEFKFKGE
jgi:hypothetical protein